jgi:hypothetical protein
VDGYNRGGVCGWDNAKWRSFEKIFTDAHNYAASHSKDLWIEECGTPEDTVVGGKAQWLTDAVALMKTWPEFKAWVYSDVISLKCDYRFTTSPSSLVAAQAIAADPYFN